MNSNTIDERIVSMEFDNERFEKNINQSMRSLEALDETIDDSARGITGSFLDINNGLSRLDLVFAGFYTKIGGYLADLSAKAVRFAKSLSFDQVSEGFGKYTAETLAVQTIVSNTNNTLEHTYEVLADILKYTDDTSYHYDKMTDTVAKFTNQGVKLETAAEAVKGIANWAALSGAGIDKADIAMSALVRAMSKGVMQAQEWSSISKSANMGTTQFTNALINEIKAIAAADKAGKIYSKKQKDLIKNLTTENFMQTAFDENNLVNAKAMINVLRQYGSETGKFYEDAMKAAAEAKTFAEALGAVKDAVSTGYAKSFRYIFGNYDEARNFWTGVQDAMLEVFTLGMDYRNNMLETWHSLKEGGYADLVESIAKAWEHVKQIVAPIGEVFHDAFGFTDYIKDANELAKLVTRFKEFTTFKFNFSTNVDELIKDYKSLYKVNEDVETSIDPRSGLNSYSTMMMVVNEKAAQNARIIQTIKDLFTNIFETIDYARLNLKDFISGFDGIFNGIGSVAKSIVRFVTTISDFILKVHIAALEVDFFSRVAKSVTKVVSSILKPAFDLISKIIDNISSKINEAFPYWDDIGDALDKVASGFEWLADILVRKAIGPAIDGISKAFAILSGKLSEFAPVIENVKNKISEFINSLGAKGEGEKAEKSVSVLESIANVIGNVFSVIGKALSKAFNYLKQYFSGMDINKVLITIKNLLVNVLLINLINFAKNLGWISDNLYKFTKRMKQSSIGSVMIPIAVALMMFAASIGMISAIDPTKLALSMGVISVLMAEMSGLAVVLKAVAKDKAAKASLNQVSTLLAAMASAVFILAKAVVKIGSMKVEDLIKGTVAISALMTVLAALTKWMTSKEPMYVLKGASAMIAMALAVDLLTIAVKSLGKLDVETLLKGVISVAAILASFAGFAKLTDGLKINARTGFAILEISAALLIIAKVVEKLGSLDIETLLKGCISVVGTILLLGASLRAFPQKNMLSIGTGLVLVSVALKLITSSILSLSKLSIEDLSKGIGALGISLLAIGAALQIAKKSLTGAASITIVTLALLPLTAVLKMLGKLDVEEIAKSLITLGLGLGILVVALQAARGAIGGAIALALVSASLIPFALALKLLSGLSIVGIAKGLLVLFGVFSALVIFGPALVAMLPILDGIGSSILKLGLGVAAVSAALIALNIIGPAALGLVSDLITTLLIALPDMAKALAESILAFAQVLTAGIDVIRQLIEAIVLAVLDVLIAAVPKVVELGVTLLTALIEGIGTVVPLLIDTILEIVLQLLKSIEDKLPDFIESGTNIVVAFIDGMANMAVEIVNAAFRMVITIINGIADAIRTHNPELLKAGWNLLTAIWDGFWDAVLGLAKKLWNAGAEIVKGIKEGLDEKITLIKDWVLDIPNKIKKWIAEKWQDAKDAGLNIINGIKDGLAGGEGGLFTKIGGIASGLLNKFKNTLGIKSPSRVFAQMGGYIDQGLANGISQYANLVNDPARQLAENAVGPVEEAVNTLNDLNLGEFSDPVVRPVLDLSEIQNGARNIGGMFGNGYSVGLGLGNVTGALSGSFAGGGSAPIINMTVNGADGQNVEELAAAVSRRLNSELRSRNSIWK